MPKSTPAARALRDLADTPVHSVRRRPTPRTYDTRIERRPDTTAPSLDTPKRNAAPSLTDSSGESSANERGPQTRGEQTPSPFRLIRSLWQPSAHTPESLATPPSFAPIRPRSERQAFVATTKAYFSLLLIALCPLAFITPIVSAPGPRIQLSRQDPAPIYSAQISDPAPIYSALSMCTLTHGSNCLSVPCYSAESEVCYSATVDMTRNFKHQLVENIKTVESRCPRTVESLEPNTIVRKYYRNSRFNLLPKAVRSPHPLLPLIIDPSMFRRRMRKHRLSYTCGRVSISALSPAFLTSWTYQALLGDLYKSVPIHTIRARRARMRRTHPRHRQDTQPPGSRNRHSYPPNPLRLYLAARACGLGPAFPPGLGAQATAKESPSEADSARPPGLPPESRPPPQTHTPRNTRA